MFFVISPLDTKSWSPSKSPSPSYSKATLRSLKAVGRIEIVENKGIGPEDMEIIDNMLRWIPTEGIVSSGIVTISVVDDDLDNPLSDIQDFMVTVTPINDSPIIVSTPDSVAFIGELYEYQIIQNRFVARLKMCYK